MFISSRPLFLAFLIFFFPRRHEETANTRKRLGHTVTYNVLDVGDVELARAFFHNDRPSLLFIFEVQENIVRSFSFLFLFLFSFFFFFSTFFSFQIKAIHDKDGQLIAGSEDSVQLVRYFWRMEFDIEARKWIIAEEAATSPSAIW